MHRKLILCTLLAALSLTACGKKEAPKPADSAPTPVASDTAPVRSKMPEGNWEPYKCSTSVICSVQVNPQNHTAIIKADISSMLLKEKPSLAEKLKQYKYEMYSTLKFDCARKLGRVASIAQNRISRSNPNEVDVVIPETQTKTEDWAKMSADRDDWAIFNKACNQ